MSQKVCLFFKTFCRFSGNFCSKSAEMKILLCNVAMGNKLYEIFFFDLCVKKLELMKQIHHFKKGFVIFLKGAKFSDFIETRVYIYKPLAIRNRFPLFWRFFFQLGSNLIKQWSQSSVFIFSKVVLVSEDPKPKAQPQCLPWSTCLFMVCDTSIDKPPLITSLLQDEINIAESRWSQKCRLNRQHPKEKFTLSFDGNCVKIPEAK